MARFETSHIVASYRDRCEDRVEVIRDDERLVIVVADGAGGTGDGRLAAETVVREVKIHYESIESSTEWSRFLSQLDFRVASGQTTAVIVDVFPDRILGASVGDSRVCVIDGDNNFDLTRTQIRKPLLGSHAAIPAPFWHGELTGTLLVGTDGFFDHFDAKQLPALVGRIDFIALPRACVESVRLPSGELWDDTTVVACRRERVRKTRQRYSI